MKGDEDAVLVLAYDNMEPAEQIKLLKKHNLSDEDMISKKEAVTANG